MDRPEATRERSLSHKDYLKTLHRPNTLEWRRISDIQRRKESEIDAKYHTAEQHEAATKIQKAYRGHRERRQLDGLTLDPSSRWVELIREMRYRGATAPPFRRTSSQASNDRGSRTPSDLAKQKWQRIGHILDHAVDSGTRSPGKESDDYLGAKSRTGIDKSGDSVESINLDMRYFMEMVDQKHRYGANLQVYHEEWQHSKTNESFFYWLDHGEGKHLDLPGCSRTKLDKERIRYLSRDERLNYLARVDCDGKLRWHKNSELITTSAERFKDSMSGVVSKDDNEAVTFDDEEVAQQLSHDRRFARRIAGARSSPERRLSGVSFESNSDISDIETPGVSDKVVTESMKKVQKVFHVSPATILNKLLRASVKPGTFIYVADTVGRLYVGIKASGAFQHTSFLSGARISSAGSIGIENGQLTYLSPLSGHYRPTTKSFKRFIHSLKDQGVDLSRIRVSHAYEILLTMEYYGKSRKGAQNFTHHKKKYRDNERANSPGPVEKSHSRLHDTFQSQKSRSSSSFGSKSSTSNMDGNNRLKNHRHSLGRLMDDLHIRRSNSDLTTME